MEANEMITFDGLEDNDRKLDKVIAITHADGGNDYRQTAMQYCLDERCKAKKAYGIDASDPQTAAMQFIKTDRFWGNENNNPFIQYVVSYRKDTAPTVEDAMRFTNEIMEPIVENHLALTVGHEEDHKISNAHTHTYEDTTNYLDGSMIYSDNTTNCAVAQRVADVIKKPVELEIKYGYDDKGWKYPKVFMPNDDEEET